MSEASEKLMQRAIDAIEGYADGADERGLTDDSVSSIAFTVGEVRALRALLAERTWRPIEEAPRTSDEVLLWWPARSSCPVGGRWSERLSLWRLWGDALIDRPFHGPGPTHFMPLPPPPEPKA